MGGLPIVVVTNARAPEREKTLANATGFEFSTFEVQAENPRATAALEARIRNGSCPAVLIAHEFLGHVVTNKISDACKESGVQWAWCGRSGVGAVISALQQIEAAQP